MDAGLKLRDPTPLLLLILLVLLLQPFAEFLIAPAPPPAAEPRKDVRLAAAMEDLARAIRQQPSAVAAPVSAPVPREEAQTPEEAPAPASELGPIEIPPAGEPVVPEMAHRYPRQSENIEAWIDRQEEARRRDGSHNTMLFFHRTQEEMLAALGIPDTASYNSGSVTWYYKSRNGRGSLSLYFQGGRVYRCFGRR